MAFCSQDDEDENAEENEDFAEGKLRFKGGGERATYDDGDAEDKAIAKAARKATALRDGEDDELDDDTNPASPSGTTGAGASVLPAGAGTPKGMRRAEPSESTDTGVDADEAAVDSKAKRLKGPKGVPSTQTTPAKKGKADAAAALVAEDSVDESAYCCEGIVTLPLDCPKLLMLELAERVAATTMLRETRRACSTTWGHLHLTYSNVL